jgi:LysR family transcriptional regulator, nitrogen assimilation regulatory protein
MEFAQLELFARIARLQSLTKTAVATNTTSSAVSRQLAVFERECGGALFHRTGRGVKLTDLGQKILPQVQSLLGEAALLANQIRESAGRPAGAVRIGVLPAHIATLLPPLFRQVRTHLPDVTLSVSEGTTAQLDEWISTGQIDIALVARAGQQLLLSEYPLAASCSHLVGAAGNPLTREPTLPFSALHQVPLVLPALPNATRRALEQAMRERQLALNVVMEATSLTVQMAMVREGLGYAVMPHAALADEAHAGRISASEIVSPRLERTIVLTTTTQRPSTMASREVLRLVRRVVDALLKQPGSLWTPPRGDPQAAEAG